jgi:hypothetical protein
MDIDNSLDLGRETAIDVPVDGAGQSDAGKGLVARYYAD